jgi:hypothetical protein
MIDFDKIAKALAEELEPRSKTKDSALIQYACIPVVVKALKLYHEEMMKDSSKS